MKKTRCIELVLITAALASCNEPKNDWVENSKVHLRSDSTAPYTRAHYHHGSALTPLLWYYAFRPYGNYRDGRYTRAGYYSGGISGFSNVGHNGFKSSVVRGGFGRGGYSVSS